MTGHQLPAPPVPANADLTHYDDMPLEVRRLRDSGIAGVADAEIFRSAVLLWCVAWHQIPAGSLPNDDAELCRLVGLGRDLKTWRKIKHGVLRGWRLFSDGRLYHPVVAEKVISAWNGTLLNRWGKECDRLRKVNHDRKKRNESPLEMPPRPPAIPLEWPATSGGIPVENTPLPAENGLNRIEGNGYIEEDSTAAESFTDTARGRANAIPAETPAPNPPPPKSTTAGKPEDQAFALWQAAAAADGWPDAGFLTTTRRFRLAAILTMCGGVTNFGAALDRAKSAAFLRDTTGAAHRWFDFDWLLDEQHFARLMEGRYDERRTPSHRQNQTGRRGSAANATLLAAALGGIGGRGPDRGGS